MSGLERRTRRWRLPIVPGWTRLIPGPPLLSFAIFLVICYALLFRFLLLLVVPLTDWLRIEKAGVGRLRDAVGSVVSTDASSFRRWKGVLRCVEYRWRHSKGQRPICLYVEIEPRRVYSDASRTLFRNIPGDSGGSLGLTARTEHLEWIKDVRVLNSEDPSDRIAPPR